jgi:hypothetical protein
LDRIGESGIKVDSRCSGFGGTSVLVFDQDFLPLLLGVVEQVQGLEHEALAALGVAGADIVGVQLAADAATVTDLLDGVTPEIPFANLEAMFEAADRL